MSEFESIRAVIDAWPTRAELAADIGTEAARVHKWAQAGSIPARYHWRIILAARERDIALSSDELARLHDAPDSVSETKKQKGEPPKKRNSAA